MNIEKQLLKYYLMDTRLTEDTQTLKKLKSAYRKLKKTAPIALAELQAKVDECIRIRNLTKSTAALSHIERKARSKIINLLKETGYPSSKNHGGIQNPWNGGLFVQGKQYPYL